MTPRAIRRAAERQAAKLARKQQNNIAATAITNDNTTEIEEKELSMEQLIASALLVPAVEEEATSEPTPSAKPPISQARLDANRQNAQHSTGPRSSAGKAKVALNAIKTGLTSQVVVMPHEDAREYQLHLARRFKKYAPIGDDEHMLAQQIIDNEWRLARVAPSEAAVYALGYRNFSADFADEEDATTRAALIRAKIMQEFRRDLSNIALQERRLRNHIEKDVAKLEELQASRRAARKSQIEYSVRLFEKEGPDFQPSDAGFDFSRIELETYVAKHATQFRLTGKRPDFDFFLIDYRKAQEQSMAA